MKITNLPLISGNFYHIYNRGNNRENIFYQHRNYIYFLKKYDAYLNDYLDTYAFCLLPNHFHFLVRVKDKSHFPAQSDSEEISKTISKRFSNFFNAYAKAINKQQNRVGSLFQKNFKRILIDNEKYLINLIFYIHANPQIHGLIDDFRDWPFSSYTKITEAKKSHLKKEEVINLFGSAKEYKLFHETKKFNLPGLRDLEG
ncbi:MAG TPA: hypothetical protein ENJ89_10900 [Caldithrix abyssi]|uniref:Transposase IS200-like domain-containing protein n=1 Tax=Caldithrix abyssi TaxID=187145 RepID=A0A7V5UFY4_CALAY|nr:hypothetical protein [Caldithrix abyssi]